MSPVRIASGVIALLFSLFYVALYAIVRGPSVIYFYPPWPAGATIAYIAGGVALQGWFCFASSRSRSWYVLLWQVGFGFAYASVVTFFLDRLHMS